MLVVAATRSAESKEQWLIGEFENFQIYSNARKTYTKRIVQELRDVREALVDVFPEYVDRSQQNLRVYVCRNQITVSRFSEIYNGRPKTINGLFSRDYEGPFIVVNAGGDFDSTRQVVYHEYVHFLTHNRKRRIPPWLNEGIAETFSTIEFKKDRVRVGEVDPKNLALLERERLIPLDRFFKISRSSPEYNSNQHGRTIFYAQSWALVHYLIYGKSDIPTETRNELLEAAVKKPWITEQEFTRIMGFDFKQMERRLRRYVSGGRNSIQIYDRRNFDTKVEIEFRKASEAEISLIYGALLLAARDPNDAHSYLINAYKKIENSPEAAAFRGYLNIKRRQWDFAAKYLEEAVDRGSTSPSPYFYYTLSRIQSSYPGQKIRRYSFNQGETKKLVGSLLKARELGESREELYQRLGEVWLGSTIKPDEEDLATLIEGHRLYPEDAQIGFYLAFLYFENRDYEEAARLIEFFLAQNLDRVAADNFKGLQRGLKEELAEN